MAQEVTSLYGESLQVERIELFGVESGYFLLPMHMAADRGASDEVLFDMAICAGYGHAFHRLVDWHVDELAMTSNDALLLAPLAELYEHKLAALAGSALPELNRLRQEYYRGFVAARQRELRRTQNGHIYTSDDLLALGDKSGPLMVLFDLADSITPSAERIDRTKFFGSLRFLAIGLQLEDDVHDYLDDFHSANITYPIAKAIQLAGISHTEPGLSGEDVGGLIRRLQVDTHCHKLAAQAFENAENLAATAGWEPFADVARACAARASEMANAV